MTYGFPRVDCHLDGLGCDPAWINGSAWAAISAAEFYSGITTATFRPTVRSYRDWHESTKLLLGNCYNITRTSTAE